MLQIGGVHVEEIDISRNSSRVIALNVGCGNLENFDDRATTILIY